MRVCVFTTLQSKRCGRETHAYIESQSVLKVQKMNESMKGSFELTEEF